MKKNSELRSRLPLDEILRKFKALTSASSEKIHIYLLGHLTTQTNKPKRKY